MTPAEFNLFLDIGIGISFFLAILTLVDIIWRQVAGRGEKTAFEKFLSRMAISFFFVGTAIIFVLVLTLIDNRSL